jgi:hypothetical protein
MCGPKPSYPILRSTHNSLRGVHPDERQEDGRPEARNDDSIAPDFRLHGNGLDPVLEKQEEVPLSFSGLSAPPDGGSDCTVQFWKRKVRGVAHHWRYPVYLCRRKPGVLSILS